MIMIGGYYAVHYKQGYVPVKVIAITQLETGMVYHVSIFKGLYDKPENIPGPEEHDYLLEQAAVSAAKFDKEKTILLQQYPVYADEENIYRIWLDEWNNREAGFYSLTFSELLTVLIKDH